MMRLCADQPLKLRRARSASNTPLHVTTTASARPVQIKNDTISGVHFRNVCKRQGSVPFELGQVCRLIDFSEPRTTDVVAEFSKLMGFFPESLLG